MKKQHSQIDRKIVKKHKMIRRINRKIGKTQVSVTNRKIKEEKN